MKIVGRSIAVILPAAFLVFGNASTWAHSRLAPTLLPDGQTLKPRSTDSGLKIGPCGGIPRTDSPVTLRPGQTVTVNWEETIQHPGYFTLSFSQANDANFTLLATIQDNQDSTLLPHEFNAPITLPNVTCSACTLQLIQYMTETTPPSLYYSCADVVLSNGPAPSPSASASPSPSATLPPSPFGSSDGPSSSAPNPTPTVTSFRQSSGGCERSGTISTSKNVNASIGLMLALPVAGLLRPRKKKGRDRG